MIVGSATHVCACSPDCRRPRRCLVATEASLRASRYIPWTEYPIRSECLSSWHDVPAEIGGPSHADDTSEER